MSITSQFHVVTVLAVNQKYVSRGGSCKCQSLVSVTWWQLQLLITTLCHVMAIVAVSHCGQSV